MELIENTNIPKKEFIDMAISLLSHYLLTCYLKFITFPFNVDSYKYQFRIFLWIIHLATCIYMELTENVNTHNIEFMCINWLYINFQSVG